MKKIILIILAIAFCNTPILSAQNPARKTDSHCSFAGKEGGNISKKEIESATSLEYVNADSSWQVTAFRLSVVGKDFPYKEFGAIDKDLTPEMIAYLLKAPVGSKFYIEYIRAGKGGGSRLVPPLSFQIVE